MDQVDNDVYFGIIPLMRKDKIYSFWDIFLITSGFAIATWCYVQGGYCATLLGIKSVILNTFFSITLAALFVVAAALVATRLGTDLWVYQRAVYGHIGVNIFLIMLFTAAWGWYSINAQVFGSSMSKLLAAFGVNVSPSVVTLLSLLCVAGGFYIAIKGPIAVRIATWIMVPSLFLVGLVIVIMVFTQYSWPELLAMKPINAGLYNTPRETFMMIAEWNIAFVFAWFPSLGALPRLVKTEREGYWGTIAGFGIVMALFICIGAITGLIMSQSGILSSDPTDWLIALGGAKLGLIALFLIGVANISTAAAGTYTLCLSTKIIKPEISYLKVAAIWGIWCCILTIWGGAWTYYPVFLALMGVTAAPGVGLIVMDYFIVRKSKISMKSLYRVDGDNSFVYTRGFNLVGVTSLIIGIAVYFLVYDPVNAVARLPIFNYTTAALLSAAVAMLTYYVASKIPAVRKYLKLERDEEQQVVNPELELEV